LSKGLGAPVGSVLVGSAGVIERARRWRKMLGGGMRQAGVLAAAGLYAIEHNVARLAEDHVNAERLAAGLAGIGEIAVLSQATNMVFVKLPEAHVASLQSAMQAKGIIIVAAPKCRLVTHLDVT